MFRKQKQPNTLRSRRPGTTLNESFRRNTVVISKSQREVAQRQQTVTQRQVDLKRALARHKARMRILLVAGAVGFIVLFFRMSISSASLTTNASSRLSSEQKDVYSTALLRSYKAHTVAGQSWLLDSAALSKDLITHYPEIERITTESANPFSTTLKADIRFRRPVFVWRDATNTEQFVDSNGILFSKNLDPSVNVKKLIRIEDQSGVVLEAGSSVLTTQLVQFVGQLHSAIPPLYGAGKSISRVIIPRSTREVQIQISGQSYLIKLSSTRPLNEEVGELAQLLTYLKSKNVTPGEYIDLRVPHKAFYK